MIALQKDFTYESQVKLLLSVLPYIFEEKVFALKGGTAINFFIRSMPRLSVDIDLTYMPVKDRHSSTTEIEDALLNIKKRIKNINPEFDIHEKKA